jgi:hypothetical protein
MFPIRERLSRPAGGPLQLHERGVWDPAAEYWGDPGDMIAASPEPFKGALRWGWIDNRPFLRCLHGLAVSAWRLGEHDSAETLCWALLWLSPGDNQGVSGILAEITAGARWPE